MPSAAATFDAAHLLVVGDVILDRYWYGSTSRISPEAPVPVVHIDHSEERPGGAGNVALNARSLGARVTLIGACGNDEAAATLEHQLSGKGVRCVFSRRPGLATVTKLRVLSQHQQLIRLDFEQPPDGAVGEDLLGSFRESLSEANAVVLSDYAKGSLGGGPELIALARAAGKPVLVDPKGRDFTRYRGATIITPNQREFEAVAGPCADEAAIETRGRTLLADLDLEALLVTRGEHGMTLIRRVGEAVHLPARAREVYDVTGAGDTVIGVLAAALASGHDLVHATGLANTAAGLVVAKLGAASVSRAELEAALHQPGEDGFGAVSEQAMVRAVRAAKLRGETVVMTNGCFDILHAGHVGYLAEARALGDRLIVAINDDASVHRLKGNGRPINALAERMAVLEALGAVDWVVPFSEDTPERLIAEVNPDVLVKGGDYAPETIAGAEHVRASGGRVVTLAYRAGCSSSRIIAAARAGSALEDETT